MKMSEMLMMNDGCLLVPQMLKNAQMCLFFFGCQESKEHTTFLITSELTKSWGKSNSFKPPNLMSCRFWNIYFYFSFIYWESISKKVYCQIPTYPVIPFPQYDTCWAWPQYCCMTVWWIPEILYRIHFKNLSFKLILASWSKTRPMAVLREEREFSYSRV